MPIFVQAGVVQVVRLEVELARFPELLALHADFDPTTPDVEAIGAKFVADGFPEDQADHFVRRVCAWGNYEGVWGKVRNRNSWAEVAARFRAAHSAMREDDNVQAIREVTAIKGLAVSFGSKHLKFLDPDRAVVLDSIISERLGYRRTPEGYAEFVADCMVVRDLLNEACIAPSPSQAHWRVSDVEMALFKKL